MIQVFSNLALLFSFPLLYLLVSFMSSRSMHLHLDWKAEPTVSPSHSCTCVYVFVRASIWEPERERHTHTDSMHTQSRCFPREPSSGNELVCESPSFHSLCVFLCISSSYPKGTGSKLSVKSNGQEFITWRIQQLLKIYDSLIYN